MTSPEPIKDRIRASFHEGIKYTALEFAVFPHDVFPRAWRYATKGGPPACRRVMVSALKRHGYRVNGGWLSERRVYTESKA
jgi:hypothetical protein